MTFTNAAEALWDGWKGLASEVGQTVQLTVPHAETLLVICHESCSQKSSADLQIVPTNTHNAYRDAHYCK